MNPGKDSKKPAAVNKKKTAPKVTPEIADEVAGDRVGEQRAARNVAKIRAKLSVAMEDPHMREQIVRAMRRLINEDKE